MMEKKPRRTKTFGGFLGRGHQILASMKSAQVRGKGPAKVTLPKLKFLEDKKDESRS